MRSKSDGRRGPRGRHGPLFRRVYLHGVLLVLFVGVTVFGLGAVLRPDRPWQDLHEHILQYMTAHFSDLRENPAQLQVEVKRAHDLLDIELSIYGPNGELEASSVDPPLRIRRRFAEKDWDDVPRAWHERRRLHVTAPLGDGAMAVARGPRFPTAPVPVQIAVVLAALLVVALGSYPLARGIVRPLERLTRTARALGQGDLSARTGLKAGGEVGALALAFDEMAERIERQMAAEKALLANVSHELRTPLSRIRVAVELAESGGPTAARHLKEIGADIDELDQLIADILMAVRLDAAPPLRRERIPARELVERAVSRFEGLFPERALRVSVADGLPTLEVDPVMVRRVIDNLLDNARKYSDGPISLNARVSAPGGGLRVEVRDDGPGIDDADQAQLFTRFFRTDRSRNRGTGGVGLGLALARQIVTAHGGEIGVVSKLGEGAVFWFELPAGENLISSCAPTDETLGKMRYPK